MLLLAGCFGSGDEPESEHEPRPDPDECGFGCPPIDLIKDPDRQAPAPPIEGASSGGTVTVYLPGDPGPDDLDPTNGWSATGNSIQQALTSRSLTQYAFDNQTGKMVLVPDLATDLGRPNEDFTEWTFTLREGVTWENGTPVTPEDVAWGITRSMDSKKFPRGPGTEYSQTYFLGAGEYKGPYTEPNEHWDGVTVDGQDITIKMAKPFPDMDYWGAFMAIGPAPQGDLSLPPDYGDTTILSSGPYKVESFEPTEELALIRNDQWDPDTDPARHQYVDRWVFKFNQDQQRVDRLMLRNEGASDTAIATSLGPGDKTFERASSVLGDRLVQQSNLCTSFWVPDNTEITDLRVRKALAYAYPYEAVWRATGEAPRGSIHPANSVMPPGMVGKHDYFVDGKQFSYDPGMARELLAEAGYEPGQFLVKYFYYEADPLQVAAVKVIEKGLVDAGFRVQPFGYNGGPYNFHPDPQEMAEYANLRTHHWCADWPSGLVMLPPVLKTNQDYNYSRFNEPSVDRRMAEIPTLPLEEQPDAWGELDEEIAFKYFPIIPTAYHYDLFAFGTKIGNGTGDGVLGAPNYKDIYVIP